MNTLQKGPFPNSSLLTLPRRGSRGQHTSRIHAARLLVRERKGMNGETDGIQFSCCQGWQRDGDTRCRAQRQLVTAVVVDGKTGPRLPQVLCSKACGLPQDGYPKHRLVHAGLGCCSSVTTYRDLAMLVQARHTPPCSGVKKGPCSLAWLKAWGGNRATGMAPAGPGHCASPQGWLRAP